MGTPRFVGTGCLGKNFGFHTVFYTFRLCLFVKKKCFSIGSWSFSNQTNCRLSVKFFVNFEEEDFWRID